MTTYWLVGEKSLPDSSEGGGGEGGTGTSQESGQECTGEFGESLSRNHHNGSVSSLTDSLLPSSNRLEMMAANRDEVLRKREAAAALEMKEKEVPNSILMDPLRRPMLPETNNVNNSKHVNSLSFAHQESLA